MPFIFIIMIFKRKNRKDVCERFIEAVSPVAVASNADKAILYGKHRKDLSNVSFLMSVDGDEFVQDCYAAVADIAMDEGMWGSVIVDEKSEFPDGFKDMEDFVPFESLAHVRKYEIKGERLEFVG